MKSFWISLLLLAGLNLPVQAQTVDPLAGLGNPVGSIQDVQGGVEVLRADGIRRERAEKALHVFLGDRLETDETGIARVKFVDETWMTVGKNTSLKITQYLYNPAEKTRNAVLHLIMGEIRMRVEPHLSWNPFRPFQYQVRTGSLVAGVRGTDFVVRALANGVSEIYGLEGILALKGVEGSGELMTLMANQYSQVTLGGWPSRPIPFDAVKMEGVLGAMGETLAASPKATKPVGAGRTGGKAVLTQGEWAQMLSETLGLAEAMPVTDDKAAYVELLTGGKAKTFEAEDHDFQSSYLAKEDAADASGGSFLEAKSLSGSLRATAVVAKAGKYPLKIRSRGTLLVSIGNQTVVVEPKAGEENLEWRSLGEFQFEGGENTINVVVSRGSAVDVLQIDARCADPIAPAGGWALGNDLTFAQKAETMVKAMDQEGSLPLDQSYTQIMRAENAPLIKGDFKKVEIRLKESEAAGSRRVVEAGAGTAAVRWQVALPADGVYSFAVQDAGTAPFAWTVDGCGLAKQMPEFTELNMVWQEVSARNLAKGMHDLEILIPAGALLDSVRIVKRSSEAKDYLALLNGLGFQEGGAGEKVSEEAGRQNLENEFFKTFVDKGLEDDPGKIPVVPEDVVDKDPTYLPDEDFPYGSPASPILPGFF